ncbi:MAG: DUF285 domain-containing protein, partial [Clostridiales bacterium]|nr:DUF285 domain-containing protein [Clostridiales bacterium]
MKGKMMKKLMMAMLCFALLISNLFPTGIVAAYAESSDDSTVIAYSGTDGDLDWSITEDGLLTITGTGDYTGYSRTNRTPEWAISYSSIITSAVVNVSGITDTSLMFNGCSALEEIDLSGLDTSEVTDMNNMFCNCYSLTNLDVSGF